jgi:hypothetical protein
MDKVHKPSASECLQVFSNNFPEQRKRENTLNNFDNNMMRKECFDLRKRVGGWKGERERERRKNRMQENILIFRFRQTSLI